MIWLPDAAPTSRVAYHGAPQTIAVMRKAVIEDADHFETRQLVEHICEGLDSKDYVSEYLAVYYFLLQHTRYMRDPRRTELVRAPYVVSKQIMAGHRPSLDCDDMGLWLSSAFTQLGGASDFTTVAFNNQFYDGKRQFSHVFTRALEPRTRQWVVFDPVAAEKTSEMLRRVKAWEHWPVAA